MDELYGKTGHITLLIRTLSRRDNVNMNLHIICNYIHCATQRIEEILRAAIFLYSVTKYTSVDSGTLVQSYSYFTCIIKKNIQPSKKHAGVTQYLEKSDSGIAFSSLKTWAPLLTKNNQITMMLWKRWKWQFTRLLVNKYQEKKMGLDLYRQLQIYHESNVDYTE